MVGLSGFVDVDAPRRRRCSTPSDPGRMGPSRLCLLTHPWNPTDSPQRESLLVPPTTGTPAPSILRVALMEVLLGPTRKALHDSTAQNNRRRSGRRGRHRRGQPHDPLVPRDAAGDPGVLRLRRQGEGRDPDRGGGLHRRRGRSDPRVGQLFSSKPPGNFGFFDNSDGNTVSHDLTRIGKTEDIDQIELLDVQKVTFPRAG